MKFFGEAVIAAASKVAGLLLAAYGVMMMRLGIMAIMGRQ
jgi:small neutral amino acid transporter SnatA (MarC family)